jgi:predicted solute-binding protein
VPLTCGLEAQVLFATPAELARRLRRNELDVALVSVTEPLLHDRYELIDGIAIASRGPVRSVLLAHRAPLTELREVFCDPASLTSVNLARVLLAERGLRPAFKPLAGYADAHRLDAVLLIGDRALDFALGPHEHQVWDLGEAWDEFTGLPFVYAAWAVRRGADLPRLAATLRAARDRGRQQLEELVRARTEYTLEFRRAYLTENVRFDLGDEEKAGLRSFAELLRRHGTAPVFDPKFAG